MDVTCQNCGAAYQLTDAVSSDGLLVQCSQCEHTFRVYPERFEEPKPSIQAELVIEKEDGTKLGLRDFAELQRKIVSRELAEDDLWVDPQGSHVRLGDHQELQSFFNLLRKATEQQPTIIISPKQNAASSPVQPPESMAFKEFWRGEEFADSSALSTDARHSKLIDPDDRIPVRVSIGKTFGLLTISCLLLAVSAFVLWRFAALGQLFVLVKSRAAQEQPVISPNAEDADKKVASILQRTAADSKAAYLDALNDLRALAKADRKSASLHIALLEIEAIICFEWSSHAPLQRSIQAGIDHWTAVAKENSALYRAGAYLALSEQRVKDAVSLAEFALRTDPAAAENHLVKGISLFVDNQLESQARSEIEAALALRPSFIRAKYYLARVAVEGQRVSAAKRLLSEILANVPDHERARRLLDQLSTQPIDHQSTRLSPLAGSTAQSWETLLRDGSLLREKGQYDLAQEKLVEALSMNTEQPTIHSELGFLYLDLQESAAAYHHFNKAIDLDQHFANAYLGLGMVSARSGQIGNALDAYSRYLALQPSGESADEVRRLVAALKTSTDHP